MLGSIFRTIFGLEKKAVQPVEPDYPRYCGSLHALMQSGRPYTLSQIQKRLGKKKGTVYHEMTELRRGGIVIKKKYDKKISAFRYRLVS